MNSFLKLIPLAIKIAQVIETLIPGGGKGREKLGMALQIADGAWESAEDLRQTWGDKQQFGQAMSRAIDASVKLLNDQGVFTKAN